MMKKILVIGTLAFVVIGCVLSAGCATWDPIVGVWELTEPTDLGIEESEGYNTFLTFAANHTGYQNFSNAGAGYDETEDSSFYTAGIKLGTYDIYWYKLSDNEYYIVYPNFDEYATLDTSNTKLTTEWGVYTKVTS